MVYIFLVVLGAAMGSFIGALIWRIHTKRDFVTERSECEHCHHKLGTLDLVPVFSWLFLRGKCRYCGHSIGKTPIILEVSMALLFAVSYIFWPEAFVFWQHYALFALWLIYLVLLVALLLYDWRWMLLPNMLVFPLIGLAIVDALIKWSIPGSMTFDFVFQHVILGGIYWILYTISKGHWVGYGDVKLGLFMGIVLGWQLGLVALFFANIVGCVILLPGLLSKKLSMQSRVPFGPFLIVGFIISGLFGQQLINWYTSLILG
jgi:leader peptidase (prepilin peptidase)/N-methyltransferase